MSKSVWDRLCKVTCEELGCSHRELKTDTSLTDDLQADSLGIVELVMAIEEEFAIEVPNEDEVRFTTTGPTMGDLEQYITRKLVAE